MRDEARTPARFDYEPSDACPCGAQLENQAPSVRRNYAWGEVSFVRCARCGSMVQSPRVKTASIAAWYDSDTYQKSSGADQGPYIEYLAQEPQRREEARARYRRDLAAILRSGSRVLEVGCATGSLLAVLRTSIGCQVTGVELSQSFANSARELNDLSLTVGDFLDFEDAPESYDLIIMLGTISNLPSLRAQISNARRLLKPDGWLYFNLPTADSMAARIYGSRYWMYAPSVCTFLTRHGVASVLTQSGFSMHRMALDRQQPTVAKLLGHLRLHGLYRFLQRFGLGTAQIPFALPIPGVRVVWARKR